jgi:hypothetical protein
VNQPQDRRAIYADVLAGLRDLAADAPVGRFDALVDELLAAGRLTDDEAAALRFWQRESLRNQADHLVTTASATLSALDEARDATESAIEAAAGTWGRRGPAPRHAAPVAEPLEDAGPMPPARPEAPAQPLQQAQPSEQAHSDEPLLSAEPQEAAVPRDGGRHRAADPTPLPTHLDLPLSWAPGGRRPPPPDVEPPVADHEPVASSARRRRLLVAGLTVIGEDGTNTDDRDASDPLAPHPFDDRPAVG